jgi:CHAT domain-containing protein
MLTLFIATSVAKALAEELNYSVTSLASLALRYRVQSPLYRVQSPRDDLDEAATVTAVKQANLDRYRMVYFATHGLVAGDLEPYAKSKAEPSLVFTIPEQPTDFDNGLLAASEVAQLKLDADWVVLSACNTAAEEKPGAEALSGLARAFFYAGARSLVVSHWGVRDESTAKLMIGMIRASSRNPRFSHAEAMRESILAMINGAATDAEADPQRWAAFVVVGEPAKPH